VADIVPLKNENRIFVLRGMLELARSKRPGLRKLMELAAVHSPVMAEHIGFRLGPRLNAAGRLATAEKALRLLLTSDEQEATELATLLDTQNRERQRIGREILDDVMSRLKAVDPNDCVIVDGESRWHIGVVGIVASRVLKEFYRPTIIFGGDGANWRGSGRSIEGFDLAQGLRQCHDLLLSHGGHAMAAGVSIQPERIEAFRQRINDVARQSLKPEQLQPALRLDAEATLGELTLKCIDELTKLEQTGTGNPPVQFFSRKLSLHRPARRMGSEDQHAKFWVTDGQTVRESVWWNAAEQKLPEGCFDLAFVPESNHHNGTSSVQLRVLDWRTSGA
jgi:single-stranded-DNA-specific exonuclease